MHVRCWHNSFAFFSITYMHVRYYYVPASDHCVYVLLVSTKALVIWKCDWTVFMQLEGWFVAVIFNEFLQLALWPSVWPLVFVRSKQDLQWTLSSRRKCQNSLMVRAKMVRGWWNYRISFALSKYPLRKTLGRSFLELGNTSRLSMCDVLYFSIICMKTLARSMNNTLTLCSY